MIIPVLSNPLDTHVKVDGMSGLTMKQIILKQKGKRTLSQFAKDIGVSRQTLHNAMRGDHEPGFKLLKALNLIKESRYAR